MTFRDVGGERLYRTGDLVRRTPAGLEFAGRRDRQVKVRGYRVELDEVEHALASEPSVAAAAVVAVETGAEELELRAYVVAQDDGLSRAELGAALRDRLPPPPRLHASGPDRGPSRASRDEQREGRSGSPPRARPR